MQSLTILLPRTKPPDIHDLYTNILKNILNELKTKYKIKTIWLVFQPGLIIESNADDSQIIDFHNYGNAIDVIKSVKPDLIIIEGSLDFSNVAFALAGHFCNVPVITSFFRWTLTGSSSSTWLAIKSRLRIISSKNILGDYSSGQSNRARTVKFFIKKLFFLISTKHQITKNYFYDFKFMIYYIKKMLSVLHPYDKIISGNLNLCSTDSWIEKLKQNNFEQNTLLQVGNPYFDDIFNRIHKLKQVNPPNKKSILFCTEALHEHGIISKQKEFHLINQVLTITKNIGYETSLKIHPSSSSISEYEENLNFQDFVKIFQKDDILELISKYDLVISYGGSSVILYAICLNKPVILLKFFYDETGIKKTRFFMEGITPECKSLDEFRNILNKSMTLIHESDSHKFLDHFMGNFDGKSSKRIADAIDSLLKNRHKK
jgi:UDP-N-acetylglucosamine:LPS N-acetylglucosamine transferase